MKNKVLISFYLFACLICIPVCHLDAADEATMQAEQWFLKTNKQVDSLYQKILVKLDVKQKKIFKESQEAWIQYREKDADAQADALAGGGSIYTTYYLGNKAELNEERIKALEKFLKSLTVALP